jgi:hypothetical protein
MEELPDLGEFPEKLGRSSEETEDLLRALWDRVRALSTEIEGMRMFAAAQANFAANTTTAMRENQQIIQVLADAVNDVRRKIGDDDLPPFDRGRFSLN